jgi:hypothetical protein
MADPTNARLRDFDAPVILPRFDIAELTYPAEPTGGGPSEPVTTVTCATPTTTTVSVPVTASTGVTPPVVKLGLPTKATRKTAALRRAGLAFAVTSDKPTADVEVRLVQLLSGGRKRPLGVKLMIQPGRRDVKVVVAPTAFALAKLRAPARSRSLRATALVTALDGSVGQATVDFTVSG